MTVDRVRVAAHAKVNLLLRILAAERSGFHQIETIFALLELADELVVQRTAEAGSVTIDVRGADVGPPEQNLAVRGARAILEATGNRFGVAIELHKRIPAGAGLGGGSSDAAAALLAVNTLANNAVPSAELLQLAARLGSDVPFFASGAPHALAWGRGERLFRLAPLPAAAALVALPPFRVATPDAYRWWDEMQGPTAVARGALALDAAALTTWGSVGRLGGNDFETIVFSRHAPLRALFEQLAQTHPYWVRMCGSGSAVAAVYASAGQRDDAAAMLGERRHTLFKTMTRAVPPFPPEALGTSPTTS
jgi:4-diphosphocytidyl-2-C-methyl-D-erythritol kinase